MPWQEYNGGVEHFREDFMADPLDIRDKFWPDTVFADYQEEIIYSVERNDETVVPAGNMLGKDFVAGFIALTFFLRFTPCRVVTTSVKDRHLRVLWGEIERFINTSAVPLRVEDGGCLLCNHQDIRYVNPITGIKDPYDYLWGTVSAKGEGLQGHHAKYNLLVIDEASGVSDEAYTMAQTWASGPNKRTLIIGNPWPCENFFRKAVDEGDLVA
jgi:hypothetical protein